MRIIFQKKVPSLISGYFAIYEYDEGLSRNPFYIDIRGIVRDRSVSWLDDLQSSHCELSAQFLNFGKWWWITSASRLDARPWGQEAVLKPMFFAKALYDWMQSQSQVSEITLVACNPFVALHLKEFLEQQKKEFHFKNAPNLYFLCSSLFVFGFLRLVIKIILDSFRMCRHVFRHKSLPKGEIIVLHELIPNTSIEASGRYFYGSLFDRSLNGRNPKLAFGCLTTGLAGIQKLRGEMQAKSFFCLLDHLNVRGFLISIARNLYLIWIFWLIMLRRIPCKIENQISRHFWSYYLLVSPKSCLRELCSYEALKSILSRMESNLKVIYPYEEKGIERAILFACQERGIETVGYTPNPQHRLLLGLREDREPLSPKPSRYAVSGLAYLNYFETWAKKQKNKIVLWGSDKFHPSGFLLKRLNRNELTVLFFVSHPTELNVFFSWLCSEDRLTSGIRYLVRLYQGVNYEEQLAILNKIHNRFPRVQEGSGDLLMDIQSCDLAIFSATSAGIIAIHHGRLGIHVFLGEFFQINPFFDKFESVLSCFSAVQLADRFDQLCRMDEKSLSELHKNQKLMAQEIYSPLRPDVIDQTLCDRKN